MTDFDPTRHPGHPGASRKHLPGLDGVRGLAVLMVMLSHFIVVGDNLDPAHPLHRLMLSGYLGVDLFFVLSGFLITGILIDSKDKPGYFRIFYIRRSLRIFPLYYGVLILAWLSVILITPSDLPRLTGHDSMAWYFAYASNISMALKDGWLASPTWIDLGHFWSLAVEEQFYLVWPLLVLLVPALAFKRLCLALVILSPVIWLLVWQWLGDLGAYVSTLGRIGTLAAGAWLAVVWRRAGSWEKLRPFFLPVALAGGLALLLERSIFPGLAMTESSLMLIAGAAVVGIAATGAGRLSTAFFQSPFLRWLGKYSYGLYVYHHALKSVYVHFLWDGWIVPGLGEGWSATLCYTLAATLVSFVLAWLSWTLYEAPILSLKRRFDHRVTASPAPQPV